MLRQSAGKRVFTTGDVARICHVASRTVTKWFDTGKLRGYRIPGSRDRRIPLAQLAAFMKENNLPMGEFDSAVRKVLVIDSDIRNDLTDEFSEMENYTVCTASTCFEAGLAAREILPHVIVISLSGGMTTSQVREIKRSIRTHKLLKNTSLFAAVDGLTTNKENELLSHGFDRCLCWPYTSEDLTNAIEETMDFVI
ncbi:MAG: helix-turn-helix domain-containing protein [Phycisphaerales bacterium]|nr:helix-turn-helix domain-containing protein [Phycisphaerales bacterium]